MVLNSISCVIRNDGRVKSVEQCCDKLFNYSLSPTMCIVCKQG